MDTKIIFAYCLCDDLLKALGHREDPQHQVSDAEILTTALVAVLEFSGCFKRAHRFLHETGYLPRRLNASRFVRRLYRCEPFVRPLFHVLASLGHQSNTKRLYIIDSFPLPVCDNIQIRRCRRYQGEAWRGYQASKRRYFYGLKIHLLVTAQGQPVEFFLTPGADSDAKALKQYVFDLPDQATMSSPGRL
nr:transposase [Rhabdochromatium marinum]